MKMLKKEQGTKTEFERICENVEQGHPVRLEENL